MKAIPPMILNVSVECPASENKRQHEEYPGEDARASPLEMEALQICACVGRWLCRSACVWGGGSADLRVHGEVVLQSCACVGRWLCTLQI